MKRSFLLFVHSIIVKIFKIQVFKQYDRENIMTKSIYVAATRQNDGKTTMSIGLLKAFKQIYPNIGFMKPVGQQSLMVDNERIDKDTVLIKEIGYLKGDLKYMSPIAVPRGFTEEYLKNREAQKNLLKDSLISSYEKLKKDYDFLVIEGTGHAGVGSIFDFNNARVAKLLNSKVVLVSKGGLGKPIDEITLNKAVFEDEGVEIIGVIMNQVLEDKYEKIKKYAEIALRNMGLKLLGVIPQQSILSAPTMAQIKDQLGGELINGDYLYENITDIVVGAMTAHYALNYIKKGTLLITPGDRQDLILASISAGIVGGEADYITGMVLTGGITPQKNIYKLIKKSNIPVILVKEDTYTVGSRVHDLLVKINPQDKKKIQIAQDLVSQYVDVDYIHDNL